MSTHFLKGIIKRLSIKVSEMKSSEISSSDTGPDKKIVA